MASPRRPAGSEGELARGGEQKNVCTIKIIKTLIFMALRKLHSSSRVRRVVAAKPNPLHAVFPSLCTSFHTAHTQASPCTFLTISL